ncbi:Hint domain-containing protein [Acidisoma silvae]|uniref:Hint domain-containing protein n=1 Tax=Acidisoma silvae TaxID=2802396 RepID=A0A964DZU4_9PROT|nr:Hint domain-containing protein [Acidisoma silvae]MCB8876661.1 Hint domain-containing protein [Acidisoma silvae]
MSDTTISYGTVSSGLVLSSGDVLDVLSGGTADLTVVSAGGIAYVSAGGTEISTVVLSRGLDDVLSGGIASGTVISTYGDEQVYGAAVDAVVDVGGSQTVLNGGSALDSTVQGTQTVYSGGVSSDTKLEFGSETVSAGGVASNTIVGILSGFGGDLGLLYVSSGGTAVDADVQDGLVYISSGGSAVGGTVLDGSVLVYNGGVATGVVVSSGGLEAVGDSIGSSLAVASAAEIAGGTLELTSGGSLTGGVTFTGSGPGLLEIDTSTMPTTVVSGFGASDEIDLTTVAFTNSGTVALNTSTDVLTVTEGGSSYSLQLDGDYTGTTFNLTRDTASGTVIQIDNGSTTTISYGTVSSGLVLSNGDVLNVLSGGLADLTVVSAGGIAYVSAGGTEISTVVLSRGLDDVLSGGIASGTVISTYGDEQVYGAAVDAVVDVGGSQTVLNGGSALDSTVQGTQTVYSGGVSSDTKLEFGSETVSAGGVASNTIVGILSGFGGDLGLLYVSSGGTAVDADVQDGLVYISSGGSAVGGTVLDGSVLVYNGGVATGVVVSSGGLEAVGDSIGSSLAVASATEIAGGTLELTSGGRLTGGVTFVGSGPGLLEISATTMPTTVISGFGASDEIDLMTVAFTSSGTVALNASTDVLTVTEGGSSYALQLAGDYTDTTFNLTPDTGSGTVIGVVDVPCFAAGTHIMTKRGPVAVEDLTLGDHAIIEDGRSMPIQWIGHRNVDCRRHPAPAKVWPVLVEAHAFGPGVPQRDLRLSPDHAIFAAGVLIPVKHLMNGTMIRQVEVDSITYFHVELAQHLIILAEDLPVESYLNTGDASSFANAETPTALHPAFGSEARDIALVMDARGYAPLRVTGPEVAAVRSALAVRVEMREQQRLWAS